MEKQEMLEQNAVCREIGARTGGDILIGVVGPVRTGRAPSSSGLWSSWCCPPCGPEAARLRARDELPQSAAGRTIMTTEPKFIPEAAVPLALEGGGECRVRLIDCVGYMVEGAMGHEEDDKPRMVKSPWFEEEIPFDLAAETGTRKVITRPLHHRHRGHHGRLHQRDPPGKLPPGGAAGGRRSWKRWASPLSSCSTAPTRTPRRPGPWRPSWSRAMAAAVLAVSCLDLDAAALNDHPAKGAV